MKPRNLTSKLANSGGNTVQSRQRIQFFRRGGVFWQRFFAILVLMCSILFSPVGTAPAGAAPLNPPDLLGPVDMSTTTVNDTPPLGIPEFSWTPVEGATKYRLQVSSDTAFTTFALNITTANVTFTPISSSVFSDGQWFWHVRVEEPGPAGDYSNAWSFTKQWASPDNLPELTSPSDYETVDFFDQADFSWTPVTGAAKYKLQVYTGPEGWATTVYTATTLTTIHQPAAKLANGTYYWRVVPVDISNHEGTPSLERIFTAGYNPILTLLEPDPNVLTHPTFTPTFRWTAVRGAQFYRLQYSTDPAFATGVISVDTRNTTYTPMDALANDINYYWRVRVHSGNSITDWTTASQPFNKRWYIKPVPLTPTNGYQHARFPLFNWTPVPGAAYYVVEISKNATFSPIYETSDKIANTFYTSTKYDGAHVTYYWRVTPYDGSDKRGMASDTVSYVSYYDSVAPEQAYPYYYYPPDTYTGFPGVTTNPHEDRTVPYPIFIWHRVLTPALYIYQGQAYPEAYELQVTTDPTFTTVNWAVTTENVTAAPTTSNPFTPLADTNYYWRVRALNSRLGNSPWSQIWKTRFDPADASIKLPATTGAAPALLRPTTGFEYAEETPLLEWFPLSGATSYDVQISQDVTFAAVLDSANVTYPAYAPTVNFAQRSLGAVDFGVYYWRVRSHNSANWSETRRYQISAESQWRPTRLIGELVKPAVLSTDPYNDAGTDNFDYDLTDILAVQNSYYWHFGFHYIPSCTPATFVLYIDLDNYYHSGADVDALGYNLTPSDYHRPEYAIYLQRVGCNFAADKILIYHWLGSSWSAPKTLASVVGGCFDYYFDPNAGLGYVEFCGPNSEIGFTPIPGGAIGSYYVGLFSATLAVVDEDENPEKPRDSVPPNGNMPGPGPLNVMTRVVGFDHAWQIGSDPDDAADDDYELTDLHVAQDQAGWFFGFQVPPSPTKDVTYALYLDLDHLEGSGATYDARGYSLATISAFRPEYAIYIKQVGGYFSSTTTYLYHWEGSGWDTVQSLDSIGGHLSQYSSDCISYLEIQAPNTLIGFQDTTGSYAISLISLPAGDSGLPKDSVPSDPNVPGSGPISRFANVTARINLVMPPNNPGLDAAAYPSIADPSVLPISWDYPILAPAAGAIAKVYLDPGFTTEAETDTIKSDTPYYSYLAYAFKKDIVGDNSYYWRVRPTYMPNGSINGVWSQGYRFERAGFVPQNLQTSVTFATPTFSWDKVEGAQSYDLQVATDTGFGSPVIDVRGTRQNTYTWTGTLTNGLYYWKVRVNRYGSISNDWTTPLTFNLSLPAPTGLTHLPSGVVGRAPTLCWTPLIISSGGTPVFAAWKYRVQVSKDPGFSASLIYDTIDTEQSCWTPIKGFADGEYYWRVATIDGYGKLGNYSTAQTFTKQYPISTLVSPLNGSTAASTPTFIWTPVNGAAQYRLDVSIYANFSTTLDSITTDNTRYTPTGAYVIGRTYYWRVAIKDANGNMGPFNNATIILNDNPYGVFLPLIVR
jgi:hypothetical protein